MSTATVSLFVALLSLLCVAGVVVVGVLALVHRNRPASPVAQVYEDLPPVALWLAWVVALVTMLGSLYFSDVAGFVPCKLCWYQRIAMYPLAVVLLVAAVRRDRSVWVYVVPVAAIGAAISTYHTQLQAFPDQASGFCTLEAPCTERYVWEFGFVSLPFMALSAFAFIIVMVLVARVPPGPGSSPVDRPPSLKSPRVADAGRQIGVS